jgi:hypothetical protein
VEWVRDRIRKYIKRMDEDPALGPVRYLVLDMSPMAYTDATGATSAPGRCVCSVSCSSVAHMAGIVLACVPVRLRTDACFICRHACAARACR